MKFDESASPADSFASDYDDEGAAGMGVHHAIIENDQTLPIPVDDPAAPRRDRGDHHATEHHG